MEAHGSQYFLVSLVLCLLCMRSTVGNSSSVTEFKSIKCLKWEKQALLNFKHGLVDTFNQLSTWGSEEEDCCKWRRVWCNRKSGHVYGLDLRPPYVFLPGAGFDYKPFGGEISSSLLQLRYLTYLDLSLFDTSRCRSLPEFIGSLINLRYLNLSGSSFTGTLADRLGNLSRLVSLDIRDNNFDQLENLQFLSHFPALKHLDMSHNNLSRAIDWLEAINKLPSLVSLQLRDCGLSVLIPPRLSFANASKFLAVIDLRYNSISSSIFPWLFNFNNSLVSLCLENNVLRGPIPCAFGAMISLKQLKLAFNNLEGQIPRSFENLCNLKELDLSENNLTGHFPNPRNFSFLEVLDLSLNSMSGVISDIHFSRLSKLWYLDISDNFYTFTSSSNWIPPFQLISLKMRSCILGPRFPQWLHTQKKLIHLDISNTNISDHISDRFWELPPTLRYLNLSSNLIKGQVYKLPLILDTIDLSFNCFHGPIPQLPPDTTILNLSKNMFSGTLSNLCSISGEKLEYLDLSDNMLTGELPDCWKNWKSMILNLANNKLYGAIPPSFGLLGLETLHFSNNNFSGELFPSLANSTSLQFVDLGNNQFSGRIPAWIGNNFKDLIVLRLRSNRFYGSIPLELCYLASLQILDLSDNIISGSIPQCFSNLTAMARKNGTIDPWRYPLYSHPLDDLNPNGWIAMVPYSEIIRVVWKGLEVEYGKTIGLVRCIDLSSNILSGKIPDEITDLAGLISLNLSRNQLNGIIPRTIGRLSLIESFDLSANHLSGSLSEGLSDLNFLSYLNLSDNNFSGKIPGSTQLQSFDEKFFMGNRELCGKPLLKKCPGEEPDRLSTEGGGKVVEDEDEIISSGFYVSMAVGFVTGFWIVCGKSVASQVWPAASCFQYFHVRASAYCLIHNFIEHMKEEINDEQ
ncbi:receptor-like protein EIX2 [Mercurialis annua]|uniref:receptor-like protein EIX2 n=1 Tax=Mercurialis annua TaxID=3986 RepID=UPI0021600A0F|nr:receptor-like protein EIX2 [Mercurialis annua]